MSQKLIKLGILGEDGYSKEFTIEHAEKLLGLQKSKNRNHWYIIDKKLTFKNGSIRAIEDKQNPQHGPTSD